MAQQEPTLGDALRAEGYSDEDLAALPAWAVASKMDTTPGPVVLTGNGWRPAEGGK